MEECLAVVDIISVYERVFNEKVNIEKFEVVFNKNVLQGFWAEFLGILQMREIDIYEKYLGFFIIVGW